LGIDCFGLVADRAFGRGLRVPAIATFAREAELARELPEGGARRKGPILVFWKGHVGMMRGLQRRYLPRQRPPHWRPRSEAFGDGKSRASQPGIRLL